MLDFLDEFGSILLKSLIFGLIAWVMMYFGFSVFFRFFGPFPIHSEWPDSDEFACIEGGQERFSEHDTNIDGYIVVVDHETGAQILVSGYGMCPLPDSDGSPLLVGEAGAVE